MSQTVFSEIFLGHCDCKEEVNLIGSAGLDHLSTCGHWECDF